MADVWDQFPDAPKSDYDYAGARAAGVQQGENGHWPDTYKLPNHITFSTDSKYSKQGQEGGSWSQVGGKWHYAPSQYVLSQHSPDELKAYFQRAEPNSVLDLPSASGSDPWAQFPDAQPAQAEQPSALRQAAMAPVGAAEMLWQGVTGGVASIPAGLAYGGAAVGKAFGANVDPSAVQDSVQSYFTHRPISDSAKAGNALIGSAVAPIVNPIVQKYGQATQAVSKQSPFAGELMKAAPGAFKAASALVPAYAGVKNAMERPFTPTQESMQPMAPAPPSKEALKEASHAAYKKAEDAGVVIAPASFDKAKQVIEGQLKGIDPTLHPDATAALKRITQTEGPVTLDQLETLRKIAKDAQGSMKPADSRFAGQIVDTIDNYAETLGTKDLVAGDPAAVSALKEARGLWSRARKSDTITEMVDRAQTRAGAHYTQAGMEHSLRQEFKTLALNQKRLRLFAPAEQEAIKNIARGGAWENSLRNLGKFDPSTGGMAATMSAILGVGGSTFTGGASMLLPVAGYVAKRQATKITAGKVAALDEMVRRGVTP